MLAICCISEIKVLTNFVRLVFAFITIAMLKEHISFQKPLFSRAKCFLDPRISI